MTVPPVIHVIDDDASFRVAISRLLAAAGYQVAAYESANEFLRQVARVDDGCILLDVRMPGLTGPELQDRLNDMDCILPVIFLTGQAISQ